MNRKQAEFWSSWGTFLWVYMLGALILTIIKFAGAILAVWFVILLIVNRIADSHLEGMLSDEEKKQRKKETEWFSNQRGP